MKVLYFCTPPLLDYSIEQINGLKDRVNLHVIIGVSLHTPNHSIFKIKQGPFDKKIYSFNDAKDKIENAELFESYFTGCKSVHFVFFPAKLGLNIITTISKLLRLLNQINPQVVHFDDISGRLAILALIIRKKIVLNIHDPAPHSGEKRLIGDIIRKLVFRKVSAFCTFSNYSKNQFEEIYNPKVQIKNLRLIPYFSYKLLGSKPIRDIQKLSGGRIILFFGRISEYKGIDELLKAFSNIRLQSNNLKLVIAGRGSYSYSIPGDLKDSDSLIIINRFIEITEIQSLFELADILVCPYRDATQSGVLMTARVFKIPVIVSNVGALPEYVQEGENGYVYDIKDNNGLENAIYKFLNETKFIDRKGIEIDNQDVTTNSLKLVDIYKQITHN